MPCYHCGKEKVLAKGLCRACYSRLRNTGSLEYKKIGKHPAQCTVEGCEKPHIAKGLCDKHYKSMQRHGDIVSLFGYGERRKHPSYGAWTWQIRCVEGREKEWNEFWNFVNDVGEKPSQRHVARRIDNSQPWGPKNFYWHETIPSGIDAKERQRIWRENNPLRSKNLDLKKNYGITLNEYIEMYYSQDGKCAICGTPGKAYCEENGRSNTLAVDHCHSTGKVRSLLCQQCNKGLGSFKDSLVLMKKAIQYVKRHE